MQNLLVGIERTHLGKTQDLPSCALLKAKVEWLPLSAVSCEMLGMDQLHHPQGTQVYRYQIRVQAMPHPQYNSNLSDHSTGGNRHSPP